MSGVVPQVAAMVGPGAAGTAYIPGLADFVPMVKDIGSMALGGPALVKASRARTSSEQELGGSKVHCEKSGVGDGEVTPTTRVHRAVQAYLSYFPSSCDEAPPRLPCTDPIERREESLLDLCPRTRGAPTTCTSSSARRRSRRVARHQAPLGAQHHHLPRAHRRALVGIVANNPMHLGGILDVDSSDKAARFIQICDAFNIPLVFLQDVPGFMVGSKVEHAGIIRHGAKMLHAMSAATVPKITVVVRKAYGAGYYVMCGRAYEPDLLVAWPTAEISVMGAEGMVGIAARKLFGGRGAAAGGEAADRRSDPEDIDIYKVAGWGLVDDVIDPRDTRRARLGPGAGAAQEAGASGEEARDHASTTNFSCSSRTART
jgi:acetyl-CoA carboxylase carboxyltransferase component